jgi:hypothetical protein
MFVLGIAAVISIVHVVKFKMCKQVSRPILRIAFSLDTDWANFMDKARPVLLKVGNHVVMVKQHLVKRACEAF